MSKRMWGRVTRYALIDCENLTSRRHLGWATRWRAFERIELFGRAWAVARWRQAFARLGVAAPTVTLLPDDAPPQAADAIIQARLAEIAAASPQPRSLVLASNDSDFAPDVERLAASGVALAWARDPRSPVEAVRLLVEELGRGGPVPAARVGEVLWTRYGIRVNGRMRGWVAQAGLVWDGDGVIGPG
ncbi:MAG: hypothetical protein ACM33T_09525 [Solirubrobacterales bacterium]